ncbi:MAG: glycosyltransferase family 4 protein [Pyrinomonadaceae bacterium]
MTEFIIFTAAFAASYFGVEAIRRWSLRSGILDIPNDRSSHEMPTPRGGGLAIVLVSLLFYTGISVFFTGNFSWSYFTGAVLVSLISWLDDLYSISFFWRFIVHSAAAVILINGLGYWQEVFIPGLNTILSLKKIGVVIAFFWIVWLINAYNFMDGIDGLAGLQAVLAGTGWLFYSLFFGTQSVYLFSGVLIFASLGFLIHNWRPAKIFMGDVGSAFLGFTFAAIPLITADEKPEGSAFLPVAAVLFVWFFVFDTAFTFVHRLARGRKVWTAHREHLYQRLVISGISHSTVSVLYGTLTLIVITAALSGFIFRGNVELFTLILTPLLSLLLIFLGFRRKNVDAGI